MTLSGFQENKGRSGNVLPVLAAIFAALLIIGILLAFMFLFWNRKVQEEQLAAERAQEMALLEEAQKKAELNIEEKAEAPADVPAEEEEDLPVTPEKEGGVVSGTARVSGTSDPAPGLLVVLRLDAPSKDDSNFTKRFEAPKLQEGDRSGETDSQGRYRIDGIPPGGYRIFALRNETDFISVLPEEGRRITFRPDLLAQTVDIEVSRGGAIFGKVIDGEENPISEAKLSAVPKDLFSSLFDPDSPLSIDEVRTSGDGSYRIAGLPLGKTYLVTAAAKGLVKATTDEIAFREGEREIELDIVLLSGSTISGQVVDSSGLLASGVEVILQKEMKDLFQMEPPRNMQADANGRFHFKNVGPGNFTLSAVREGREASKAIESDGETPIPEVVLILEAPPPDSGSGKVTGRVTDDTGKPLADVQIQLAGFGMVKGAFSVNTKSKEDGTFTIENVPAGVFNLVVQQANHAPYMKSAVSAGQEPIDVVLQRVSDIKGTIVSRATGDPIEGALVRLNFIDEGMAGITRLMAGQIQEGGPSAKSGPDGTFLLEKIAPGRARLRAEASGFGPGFSEEFEILPGETLEGAKVELSEGGSISGVVLNPDGNPVGDALIRALESTGNLFESQMRRMIPALLAGGRVPSTKSEGNGSFLLEHLPEAKLTLTASHPDFAPSGDLEVTLGLDERREKVLLKLRKPGTIRVRAIQVDKPLPGLMVQVLGAGPMKMMTSDAEGKAEFTGLGPGDYLVQLLDMAKMMSGQGMGLRQQVATVGEGQTEEVEFKFGVGAKVSGKVIGELPSSMNMVVISRPEGPKTEEIDATDFLANIRAAKFNVGTDFIKPDGTFTIPDVPDGEFVIEIPKMPTDMNQYDQLPPEEKKPYFRKTIQVKNGKDLELPPIDLRLQLRGAAMPSGTPTEEK